MYLQMATKVFLDEYFFYLQSMVVLKLTMQQHNVPRRMIDKVEFENKSLKTENAKFEDWNDHL